MTTIQRANVVLSIDDDPILIQKYKDKGYNVIDEKTGEILERAIPHEPTAMRSYITELEERIRKQEEELVKLRSRKRRKN